MKAKDITVGGLYKAKVSGHIVTVRVDNIDEGFTTRYVGIQAMGHSRKAVRYAVTNLSTGRKTTFRSAAKFRTVAKSETLPMTGQVVSIQTPEDIISNANN